MTLINRVNPLLLSNIKKIGTHTLPYLNKNQQIARDRITLRFADPGQLNSIEQQAHDFISRHAPKIQKLTVASNNRAWDSYTQGGDYKGKRHRTTNQELGTQAEKALKEYFDKKKALSDVKELLSQKDQIDQSIHQFLVPQLEVLYGKFQDASKTDELLKMEKELIEEQHKLETSYNNYKPLVDGKVSSEGNIRLDLEKTEDANEAKKLWMALNRKGQMVIGPESTPLSQALGIIADSQNEVARKKTDENGNRFRNYFSMTLYEAHIDEEKLSRFLAEVEEVTEEPYRAYREIHNQISQKRYGISAAEANLPWYGYGEGNDKVMVDYDLAPLLHGKDPLVLLEKAANLMGGSATGSVKEILEKSFYDRNSEQRSSLIFDSKKDEGKSQHPGFSFKIDPPTDVRAFARMNPSDSDPTKPQMGGVRPFRILIHEILGHGLGYKNLDPNLPYLLRSHHPITTHSIAFLSEDMMHEKAWFEKVLGLSPEKAKEYAEKARLDAQMGGLTRIRKLLRDVQFERQLYEKPTQDLNILWWTLQKKYLGIEKPEGEADLPEFATVGQFYTNPGLMPKYFLGALLKEQKAAYFDEKHGGLLNEGAAADLKANQKHGISQEWDVLAERMTGEELGAEAFKRTYKDFGSTIKQIWNDNLLNTEVVSLPEASDKVSILPGNNTPGSEGESNPFKRHKKGDDGKVLKKARNTPPPKD